MLVTLIVNKDGRAIGYNIERERPDEADIIEQIRDMHFWMGTKYKGREADKDTDDTIKLTFALKDNYLSDTDKEQLKP